MGPSSWRSCFGVCVTGAALTRLTSSRASRGIHARVTVQNGFAESFHARLRDEFLDGEAFVSVLEAQVRLGLWRRYYNDERLHSSLEYQMPKEFAARWAADGAKNAAETKALTGT